jgi:outer membrane protein TolC
MDNIVIPSPGGDIVIPSGPGKLFTNKVYLMYSQPLLQNFAGKLDRLSYELSEYTIGFTELQALENQELFLLDLGNRFLDWTLLSEQWRIANDRLELAQAQLQRTKRMHAANLVEKVDVLRTEDAVRIAEQTIVLIESQWKAKQAELAVLAQSPSIYTVTPEFNLYSVETMPELDEAVIQIREKSRILKALDTQHDQLLHLRDAYHDVKRPQLYLNVGAGLQRADEEFESSIALDQPDILVSLTFRYPLGNRTAKADVAKTDLEIRQLEKVIEDVGLDLEAGVRNILISINEMEKVLVLNQEQIESAGARTREEQRLYNQGRSDLAFVIQSQDNEAIAELTYAENAATYHTLVLQYRALMDEFLNQ